MNSCTSGVIQLGLWNQVKTGSQISPEGSRIVMGHRPAERPHWCMIGDGEGQGKLASQEGIIGGLQGVFSHLALF